MKLSIIIPSFNEEKYLPILLEGLKKQKFKDYEIIVADGGSVDRTIEIAKGFGCKVVNGGLPGEGRNKGAEVAKGDLFLFMDADNKILHDDFLQKLIMGFEKRDLGVASFPIYPDGTRFDKFAYCVYNTWVKMSQSFLPHATNSILVKREIHKKIRGFDEQIKLAEDHDYVRRAKKYGRFGFINIKPVLTSPRRFEKDGRLKTYLKYVLAGFWMLFFGPIKSDIFKYKFIVALKNKIK